MAKRRGNASHEPAAPAIDPKDPAAASLERARAAKARGDFRTVRALVKALLAGSAAEPVKSEAQQLELDTRPDPAALLVAGVVFLVIVIAAWVALLGRR